jgi:uncharacterized protein YjbI with pentapeptide repeats
MDTVDLIIKDLTTYTTNDINILKTHYNLSNKDTLYDLAIAIILNYESNMPSNESNQYRDFSYMSVKNIKRALNTTKLDESNLSNINFTGVDFINYNLSKSNLSNSNLSGALLNNANLNETILNKAIFVDANLNGSNMANVSGTDITIVDSDLTNVKLSNSNIQSSTIKNSTLINCDMSNSNLINNNFTNSDLSSANLFKSNLTGSKLNNVVLNGGHLYESNISNCDLTKANMEFANLIKAKLNNSKLNNAYIVNADLTDADLSGADLTGANLSNSILVNTNMTNTILTGAIMNGVIYEYNLDSEDEDEGEYDSEDEGEYDSEDEGEYEEYIEDEEPQDRYLLSINNPINITEVDTEKCNNPIDVISQESWSDIIAENNDVDIIQIIVGQNPEGKDIIYCTLRENFVNEINNQPLLTEWVINESNPEVIQRRSQGLPPIDESGYGTIPKENGPKFVKINYQYLLVDTELNRILNLNKNLYKLEPVISEPIYIGNVQGSFGASQSHGQDKDIIYKLTVI